MDLHILVGCIASGKSTYTLHAAQAGYLCVNDDSVVNMLHGNDYTLYNEDFKILYKSIENHMIASSLAMDRSVIVDRGLNISLQGRKRFIALAKSFDIQCHAIVFKREKPEVHAERRFKNSRGHTFEYWLKVAQHHDTIYTMPSIEEGFDKIHEISWEEIQIGKVIF